jgi:hypothetical protein
VSAVQIPNLGAAIALNGSEQLEAVQAGTSVRVTTQQISNFTRGSLDTVAAGKVLGRDTASGTGPVQELPIAVDASGNVGIRMSSPTVGLDVAASVRIGNPASAAFLVDFGQAGVGTYRSAYIYGDGTNVTLSNQQNGYLGFHANNTERMRITATGNVGIGTGTPSASAALEVASATGGVLFPRMTTTQRDAIGSPANGLVLYNITTDKLQVRAAGAWVDLH